MQALAGLLGNLPNSVNLGVDSLNRYLDRKSVDDRISRREKAYTDAGLPSFLAHQGTNSNSDGYRPPASYNAYGPRTFLRTGLQGYNYKGPNAAGWYNPQTIKNNSTATPAPGQQQGDDYENFLRRQGEYPTAHYLSPWDQQKNARLEAYYASRSTSSQGDRGSFINQPD